MPRLATILALGASGALLVSGCGSGGDQSPAGAQAGAKQAYTDLEKQLTKGDPAACAKMTTDYKNKLAASVQLFSADCPAVVAEVGKGLRADPDLLTKSIDQVKVTGGAATMIAHSTYHGNDVRTQVKLKRGAGGAWIMAQDHELDDVAPSAPLTAYHAYIKAFKKADGKTACALSTKRGRALIIQTVPQSHGGGTCEGAIPFLAVAAAKIPVADVVGGETKRDTATLYTLQSTGNGAWAFREVVMQHEGGKWLFDYSRDLGVAPARRTQGGQVV